MNDQNKHPEAITRAGEYSNPFQRADRPDHLSHGAVAIESERAIAQIQAKVIAAHKFPRDPASCFERVKQACSSLSLAEAAFYSYPRGGEIVHGATIRLAEELAQIWGNIDIQVIELARREGETELQAVAWDLETNTSSAVGFTVKHRLDRRDGSKELTDQRDIRDLTANISARKIRGQILAILPEALVRAAIDMCRDTLAKSIGAQMDDKCAALIGRFKKFGVTEKAILKFFDVKNAGAINVAQATTLSSIYRTLKAGEASAFEIFEQGMSSEQIRARKAQGGHQAPAPSQGGKAPASTAGGEQGGQEPPQKENQRQEQPKPEEPKKGTVAWYKMKIQEFGAESEKGAKLKDLQAQYAALLEADMRAKRQGEQEPLQEDSTEQSQHTEPGAATSGPPEVPGGLDDDDDWFNE
jgi:hypothetical protein